MKLLKCGDVEKITGLSRYQVKQAVKSGEGSFPKPVPVPGMKQDRWNADEVNEYVANMGGPVE